MTQVIIYSNQNGGVSVCYSTGELPIEEVLVKDCPAGAIIVDVSALPETDNDFFDAWRLNGSTIIVDLTAAKAVYTDRLNALAKQEAQHRATNTAIGVGNTLSDATFIALLNSKRAAIVAATSTAELRAVNLNDITTA